MADERQELTPQTENLARRSRAPSVLSPRNSTELLNYSKLMAASDMVPDGFKSNAAKIAVAIQMGAELGFTPVQALTCIAVINGMPSMYGDGLNAVLRASGKLDLTFGAGGIDERPPDEAWAQKEGYCAIKLKGWEKPIERRFSFEDAERAGLVKRSQGGANARGVGPWISYPGRMLMFKARNWCFRDGAADVLKGLQQAEVLEDVMRDAEFTIKEPARLAEEGKKIEEFVTTTGKGGGMAPPARSTGGRSTPPPAPSDQTTWSGAIKSVRKQATKNPKFPKIIITGADGKEFQTIKGDLGAIAKEEEGTGQHMSISYVVNQFGNDLVDITRKEAPPAEEPTGEDREPGSEG